MFCLESCVIRMAQALTKETNRCDDENHEMDRGES